MYSLPSGPRRILFREYLPVMTSLLDELRDVAKSRRKTVPQVALNWIMQKGFIPLVGMRSMKQAQDNLAAIGWSLSSSEVDCIDVAALKVRKSLLQNINQSD